MKLKLRFSILPHEIFIRIASGVLIAIVFLYFSQMFKIISSYPSIGAGLLDIRYENLAGEPVIPLYSIYINAIQVLFAFGVLGVCISTVNRLSCRVFLYYMFCVGLAAFASLLDGSRSFFVMGILWIVAALYWQRVISIKLLLSLVLVLIFIFSITFSMFRPVAGGLSTGLMYASLYFSGGVGAFGVVFDFSPDDLGIYWQSLELLTNKLSLLGFPIEEHKIYNLRNDFVYISDDLKTNVFTSLGLYYWYLGYYMFVMALITGFIGGWLMKLSKSTYFGMWMYPLFLCALVMSLFHDYYLPYGYYILKVILCLVVIKILSLPLQLAMNLTTRKL
jgi:oligosaccharide repeat unit polymerase